MTTPNARDGEKDGNQGKESRKDPFIGNGWCKQDSKYNATKTLIEDATIRRSS